MLDGEKVAHLFAADAFASPAAPTAPGEAP
jgi:hypothetical protein